MDWGAVILLVLIILGAAFVVGGIVAYRGSRSTGVRAIAVAAGVAMWAIVLFVAPVSRSAG